MQSNPQYAYSNFSKLRLLALHDFDLVFGSQPLDFEDHQHKDG